MATDTLKDFTVQWVLFGLLFVCLLIFAINFIVDNNPSALNENMGDILGDTSKNLTNRLIGLPEDSNIVLNVTAKTNPEESYLGSQDTVSTGYKYHGTAKDLFQSSVSFFKMMLGDTSGTIVLAVVGGLLGFLGVYLIYKWIKAGI